MGRPNFLFAVYAVNHPVFLLDLVKTAMYRQSETFKCIEEFSEFSEGTAGFMHAKN